MTQNRSPRPYEGRFDITEEEWRWIALLLDDALTEIVDDPSWSEEKRVEEIRALKTLIAKVHA